MSHQCNAKLQLFEAGREAAERPRISYAGTGDHFTMLCSD
jgi:hypothetical protein